MAESNNGDRADWAMQCVAKMAIVGWIVAAVVTIEANPYYWPNTIKDGLALGLVVLLPGAVYWALAGRRPLLTNKESRI